MDGSPLVESPSVFSRTSMPGAREHGGEKQPSIFCLGPLTVSKCRVLTAKLLLFAMELTRDGPQLFASRSILLYTVALGTFPPTHEEQRRSLGVSGCVFVYVGRLWKGKGLDELLTAYRNLEGELGIKVSLLVIGDGVDQSHYRELFMSLPRVVMPGFVQPAELPGWYALADCLVFPTHGDPNGLVVEEALAAGLPVIVTDAAGDIGSRVPEGVAGYVIPVGSADALQERMGRIARSPALHPSPELTASKSVEGYATDFEAFVAEITTREARSGLAARVCRLLGHFSMLVARLQRWQPAPYVDAGP